MDKFSRQFSKREKVLLIFLALVLVATAYYFLVHKPVTESIAASEADIAFYQAENPILEAKKIKKEQMLAEVNSIMQDPNAQEIPVYDNLSMLTAYMDSILQQTMSYTMSVGDAALDQGSGIYRRGVSVSCTVKSYAQCEQLIKDIKNCPYCSQVGSVSFSPFNYKGSAKKYVNNIEDGGISLGISITFFESR